MKINKTENGKTQISLSKADCEKMGKTAGWLGDTERIIIDEDTYNRGKPYVSYVKMVDGKIIDINGTLSPFNTGRDIEYKFEPDSFQDVYTEEYYNENWETIEKEILEHFYK
jgi:hypothetical protein